MMEYMFRPGFLGTKAPFFMDIVTLIVALLPLLVATGIYLAKIKAYRAHRYAQSVIFAVSLAVVGYFEYGIRKAGGYEAFLDATSVSHGYLAAVLGVHIVIATVTLGLWVWTLYQAYKDAAALMLPGLYSGAHKKSAKRTFIGIVLTALTGIWVYLLLFAF